MWIPRIIAQKTPLFALLLLPLSTGLAQSPDSTLSHPWFAQLSEPVPPHISLQERFPSPKGYARIPVEAESFGAFIRQLPVRTDRTHVLSYKQRRLNRPSAGVLLMDVGNRDLMQCADSVIRLHAEYLWSTGQSQSAKYRFTSGDLSKWSDWVLGERLVIDGNKVVRKQGSPRPSTYESYRSWLDLIFTYAGTRSLGRDTPSPSIETPIVPGDFYVDPGSPGHAVMVLDVVVNDAGKRLGLIAQGFMPAEDIHVVQASHAVGNVWFPLPEGNEDLLDTPSWNPFAATSRRRFK